MNKYAIIAKLINKKISSYLRVSIIIFILAFILVSSVSLFLANQYIQSRADFIDNGKLHLIEITSRRAFSTGISRLDSSDNIEIDAALKSMFSSDDYMILTKFHLPIGVNDGNENKYDLYAIDAKVQDMLGSCKLDVDVVCSIGANTERITLKIPVVTVEKDGMRSDTLLDFPVNLKKGVSLKNPFGIYDISETNTTSIVASTETFGKILHIAFGVPANDITAWMSEKSTLSLPLIDTFYVYLNKLENVEQTAHKLTDLGYNVNYPLKAFDDLNKSINTTLVLCALISLLIIVFVVAYIMLSINSFIKVQHKDMGILKQFGYTGDELSKIYTININKIFSQLVVVISLYIIIVGIVSLGIEHWQYVGAILAVFLVILLLVSRAIVTIVLRRHTSLDTIRLLKIDKEFE